MSTIDVINLIGRNRVLKPFGLIVHSILRRLSFIQLVTFAGRRLGGPIYGACLTPLTGTTVKQNLTDGLTMFHTIEKFVLSCKPDLCLCAFPDLSAEAEACGCKVKMPDDSLPSVIEHPVQGPSDLKAIQIPDPEKHGRLPVFIEATKLFAKRFKLLSIAPITGPFTLYAHLMGAEAISKNIFKNPKLVIELMELSVDVLKRHNLSLVKAGADIIAIGEPTASLLSPKAFENFVFPSLKRLIKAIPRQVLLHICGNAGHLVTLMCGTGAAGISVDSPVNLLDIKDKVPSNIVIYGNLSPVEVLMMKKPDEVKVHAQNILQSMKGVKNFILGSGCDLPVGTPMENITAMLAAVKS